MELSNQISGAWELSIQVFGAEQQTHMWACAIHCSGRYILGCTLQEQQKRDKAMAARMRKAEEDDMSEMDKAKELLKMKTVKIQQAAAPEVTHPPHTHTHPTPSQLWRGRGGGVEPAIPGRVAPVFLPFDPRNKKFWH